MLYSLDEVKLLNLHYDFATNGDLTVMEEFTDIPFSIARVFVVRGFDGSVRGKHAHKACSQFLTCPYGRVEVQCNDGSDVATYILDKPNMGLLIPPSIWAQQTYLIPNSVLTVLCDRPYESQDYIRNFDDFRKYRKIVNAI
jgi:dTDP-4-dehydrorhamnose 3,5-epimerase-like enzyme